MEYKVLKDIATITMGQSPDSSSYNEEENGIPFYQGNADFGELYPTARVWCNAPKKTAKEGDILISVRAPIGALNYAAEECCIGRGLAAITIENETERNYVFHLLKARNKELNNKGTGSTFKAIGKSVLEDVQVPVISAEQQELSMKLIDMIEQIVRQRKQELVALDDLVKARFVEMFGDVKTNVFGWERCSFEDVTTKITDGEHGTVPRVEEGEGYLYFMARNITKNGLIDLSETSYVPEEVHQKIYKRCNPEINDILLVCVGATIGKSTLVTEELGEFSMARSVALLKPDFEKVNSIFLINLLKSDAIQNDISNCAHAAAQAGLYTNMIKSLDAFLPPIELQNQFADFVRAVDKSKVVLLSIK